MYTEYKSVEQRCGTSSEMMGGDHHNDALPGGQQNRLSRQIKRAFQAPLIEAAINEMVAATKKLNL